MSADERAIRSLIDTWLTASRTGDTVTVLSLMSDDVIFMVPGREPFGKEAFAETSEAMKETRIDGRSDIRELKLLDDWAYLRNHLEVTITPPDGKPVRRSGYTLTILRKEGGRRLQDHDANLLAPRRPTRVQGRQSLRCTPWAASQRLMPMSRSARSSIARS